MAKLLVLRGLPASGKTTFALFWLAGHPEHRARVNRDDLRSMAHNGTYIKGVTEDQIITMRNQLVKQLLRKGIDVVSDDVNLSGRNAKELRKLADQTGSEFEVLDFTHIPLEECIRRDRARENGVGENVIRSFYMKYLNGKDLPLPVPEANAKAFTGPRPYEPNPVMPNAVIVDIDGTVALHNGRNPYHYHLCFDDLPNQTIINLVEQFYDYGYEIIFVSGRDDSCRNLTIEWLCKWLPFLSDGDYGDGEELAAPLYMRAFGDGRADYLVKTDLFDEHIRDYFNVRYVLDDRNSVVANWREMGLTVLQVADGDF